MPQHVLLLDLVDDAALIAEYERHHQAGQVWPEVTAAIRASGIRAMRLYRHATRLVMVMVMEVDDGFDFAAKAARDAADPAVRRWEALMDRFQRALPDGEEDGDGAKWRRATPIFDLADQR